MIEESELFVKRIQNFNYNFGGFFNEEMRDTIGDLQHVQSEITKNYLITCIKNYLNYESAVHFLSETELQEHAKIPIKWHVDNHVPEEAIVFLAGKRGSYKTWTALSIALAIASGSLAFNKINTQKCNVLYINGESSNKSLGDRINKLKNGMGLNPNISYVNYTSSSGFNIQNPKHKKELEDYVTSNDIKVIVVDSFRRICNVDENSATEVNALFEKDIKPFCVKYGITWIFLHHERKTGEHVRDFMDEMRGSSELSNIPDIIIRLLKTRTPNIFKLYQPKNRHEQEQSPKLMELKWVNTYSCYIELIGDVITNKSAVQSCIEKLLEFPKVLGKARFKKLEIINEMKRHNVSGDIVTKALKELRETKKIIKISHGLYEIPNPP